MNRRLFSRLIRSSAPIRINDIGGWTDTWFAGEGRVLNLAVSPRVHVEIKELPLLKKSNKRVRIFVRDFGETIDIDPMQPDYKSHPMLQAAVSSIKFPEDSRLEISVQSQVPAGSAVGSSAAVNVALLGGLARISPETDVSPAEIASLAHKVETEKLGLQCGIQDQICSAWGGVCFIQMHRYPEAQVERIRLETKIAQELENRIALIFLGKSHQSSVLHEKIIASLEKKEAGFAQLKIMGDLAVAARTHLLNQDLEAYGEVMIKNNECQRALHPDLISSEADAVMAVAQKFQAAGWKVNGAGGPGGSLTVLGSEDLEARHDMLLAIEALGQGIRSLPVALSGAGLEVSVQDLDEST